MKERSTIKSLNWSKQGEGLLDLLVINLWSSYLVRKMLDGQGPSRSNQESSEGQASSSTSSRTAAAKKESKSSASRAPKTRSTAAKRYQKETNVWNVASAKLYFIHKHLKIILLTIRVYTVHKQSLFSTLYHTSPPSRWEWRPRMLHLHLNFKLFAH